MRSIHAHMKIAGIVLAFLMTLFAFTAMPAPFAHAESEGGYISSNTSRTSSGSVELAALKAKIDSLMAQYAELKAALSGSSSQGRSSNAYYSDKTKTSSHSSGPSTSASPDAHCAYSWTRTLSYGSRGEDVEDLQKALKSRGFYGDEITGFYGNQTQAAVQKYQSEGGIVSLGDPSTTGYGVFGSKTRSAYIKDCLQQQENDDEDENEESEDSDSTDAPSEATLEADPDEGTLPLEVTFAIDGQEDTSYVLDFGDRSIKKTVEDGDTIEHTYKKAGTFIAKLLSRSGGYISLSAHRTMSGVLDTVKVIVSDEDEDEDDDEEESAEEDEDTEDEDEETSSGTANSCVTPYYDKSAAHGTYASGYSKYFWKGPMPLTVVSPAKLCQSGSWTHGGYCGLNGIECSL